MFVPLVRNRRIHAWSRIPRKQDPIQADVTSNNHFQTELLCNQLFSTTGHCTRGAAVTKQIEDSRRQSVRSVWWHEESAPALAYYLAATWHVCRYDRQAGK